MPRYPIDTAAAEPPLLDGDDGFLGVKMRGPPSRIPPGYAREARNCRFTDGVCAPRKGVCLLPWTNKVTVSAGTPQPFTTIHGVGVFNDPNSVQWIIFAAEGKCYKTRENNGASEIPLPAGVTITSAVKFRQCMNVMLMLRGTALAPLVMENVDMGWRSITLADTDVAVSENPSQGTVPIPNSTDGLYMQNRFFALDGTDEVYPSDFLNYTRFKRFTNFKIERGAAEELVAIHQFTQSTMIAFKNNSVHVIDNVTGALAAMTRYQVTDQYGCVSARSVVTIGKDVWFMANRRGVCSINQTEQNKFQGVDVPVSDDVQPLIDRINWRHAGQITAAQWGNRSYWAVPLDDAEVVKGEIISSESYSGGAFSLTRMIAGRKYRWAKGANDIDLVNGSETLTASGDFTAQTGTVTLHGSGAVTASLRPIFQGVNNAVLVCDHLNRAWAGHDTGESIMVKDWIVATYNGADRLFCVTEDGFIALYEELFEDQFQVYERPLRVDVTLSVAPTAGIPALRLDSGTTTGTALSTVAGATNGAGTWAIGASLAAAAGNLWRDGAGNGGYDATAAAPWNAPNTTRSALTSGVRFTSSNGVRPEVRLYSGSAAWFTVGYFGGVEKTAVAAYALSRGYTTSSRLDRKQARQVKCQVKTWKPRFTLNAVVDGVAETFAIETNSTRDRTRYRKPWRQAAYAESNVNGDHGQRHREDYSIQQLPGQPFYAASPVNPDLHQEDTLPFRCPRAARGRYLQIELSSDQGRVELHSVQIEASEADRAEGAKA